MPCEASFNRTTLELKKNAAVHNRILDDAFWPHHFGIENWIKQSFWVQLFCLLTAPLWNWKLNMPFGSIAVSQLLTAPLWNWKELKIGTPLYFPTAFNRTTLELKNEISNDNNTSLSTFNRTTLELKKGNGFFTKSLPCAFNRTTLELKNLAFWTPPTWKILLTAPLWNWKSAVQSRF